MDITDRAAVEALQAAGLGSLQEIQAWMRKRQQKDLRIELAGKAMQAILPVEYASYHSRMSASNFGLNSFRADMLASDAFKMADALLAASAK